MALKLTKTTGNGYVVEHWVVSPVITVNFEARAAFGKITAYKDKASKDAGKMPMREVDDIEGFDDARRLVLTGQAFEDAIVTGDLRAAMYAELKTKGFFAGSVDE